VKVALLISVSEVKAKSSADSISILPADVGLEAVAILPSGLPVLKKKVLPALAEPDSAHAASRLAASQTFARIDSSFDNWVEQRGLLRPDLPSVADHCSVTCASGG
jgi:hypothetical protein